jgi:16S rRNA (guanine527-N7)-methyltransferase
VEKARNHQPPEAIDRAINKFLRHAPTFGVEPTLLQIEQIRTYVTELLRWNEKINLTAAKGPEEVLLRHVLDALAPLGHLSGVHRLLDVGTGGGLPGIPIKVFRQDILVSLLEARRKKVSFNQHVVDRLGLEGVEVIWGRLGDEEINGRYANRPFDGMVTRAALSAAEVLRMGKRILQPGGKILLMMGTIDEAQRVELQEEAITHGSSDVKFYPYGLPGLDRTRNLVLIR